MILSGSTIRRLGIITPHEPRSQAHGMSYGESYAGYDIRLKKEVWVPEHSLVLGVSLEHFVMPTDVIARVHDKSTNARRGIHVLNTIIEPGWRGFLTVEIGYKRIMHSAFSALTLPAGCPIAQIIFERIDCETDGYDGKYQDQPAEPVPAQMEVDE